MEYESTSHRGVMREKDEDALIAMHISLSSGGSNTERFLFILADGMGGHRAGEVASSAAVKKFSSTVLDYLLSEKEYYWPDILEIVLKETNKKIHEYSLKSPELSGMGTTLIAALITGNTLNVINVGDSRLYLLRCGEMNQVTKDHSLVQELLDAGRLGQKEALHHPSKGRLTKAVGIKPSVEPEQFIMDLIPGDFILLCCDGLTDVVSDQEIKTIILLSLTAKDACSKLVERANELGGPDNISLILIKF